MAITINGTTGIAGVDGSASTPAVQGTDTNTGEFFPAADTIAWTTGGSERMRVDSSGNVGTGTSNTPSNKDTVTPKFVVNGTGVAGAMQVVRNTTPGGGGGIIELTATRGSDVNSYTILQSGDGIGSVIFGGADGNEFVPAASIVAAVDGTPGDNDMPGRLVFSTTADGASSVTERMRIDSSGRLLLATTTTVDANAFMSIRNVNGTTGGIGIGNSVGSSDTNCITFFNSNGQVGRINTSGGATGYVTSSDYRLKEDIAPMTGALNKVVQLKPVTYKWKADGSFSEGFIAHELQTVVPDCVFGKKDAVDADGNPIYQGIDTSFLVATLTAAIQELKALVDTQASTITQLQADVAALKGTP